MNKFNMTLSYHKKRFYLEIVIFVATYKSRQILNPQDTRQEVVESPSKPDLSFCVSEFLQRNTYYLHILCNL